VEVDAIGVVDDLSGAHELWRQEMTLDEIRSIVADTTAAHWHVLSGDAPTYLNRFGEIRGADEHWLQHSEHDARAVLRRDLDVGLAWGMEDRSSGGESLEPDWTSTTLARRATASVVDVLYRGQPVDREVYAVIDNGHGLVPWPRARFAGDAALADVKPEALEVSSWQRDLVMLLRDLGVAVGAGSVEDYMRRCGITVVD
jgi:hypothetical protein